MKKSLAFVILSTVVALGLILCFGVSKSYCQEGLILPHADNGGAVWSENQLDEWNQDYAPDEVGGFLDIFKAKTPVKTTSIRVLTPADWDRIYYGFDSYDSDDIGDDYAFMAKPKFWRLNRFKERLRGGDPDYAVAPLQSRLIEPVWLEGDNFAWPIWDIDEGVIVYPGGSFDPLG